MLKVVFLYPKCDDHEAADRFIEKYVIAPIEASPGFRSLSTNSAPLMSPFGPPPYYRVVEATLGSLDDFITIGRSDLIQESQAETPEGFQIIFYECDD
jgi:hypothetical protein